ncbi:hypothetical protein EYF80_030881 [Liparis tanakae]|uniref:Uncharacterized protein n=1 Tax=Liparis tanakae TaxID=230148 RepID=A0A4Z2GZW1_9TELE|nr:hypothetical protein EYF80_030881 [Liparis tanakae]
MSGGYTTETEKERSKSELWRTQEKSAYIGLTVTVTVRTDADVSLHTCDWSKMFLRRPEEGSRVKTAVREDHAAEKQMSPSPLAFTTPTPIIIIIIIIIII